MRDRFIRDMGDYLRLRIPLGKRCSVVVQARLECNMVTPVTDRAVAKTRLKTSAEMTGASRAPNQAAAAWAGAMQTHIVMSMLPSSSG